MPVALISTRTSPTFGPSRSTSTISSGFLASKATAARVFILSSSNSSRAPRTRSWSGSARSLLAHARIFVLGIGVVLVLVLAGSCAAPGDDAEKVGIAHRLQRILQRRGVGRAHAIRAVTHMAVRVIAAVSGIGVPVDGSVSDLVGWVAFLVGPFAGFVLLDGSRI